MLYCWLPVSYSIGYFYQRKGLKRNAVINRVVKYCSVLLRLMNDTMKHWSKWIEKSCTHAALVIKLLPSYIQWYDEGMEIRFPLHQNAS